MVLAVRYVLKKYDKSKLRTYIIATIIISGIILVRFVSEPGIEAIEEVNPAKTGFLGGFGLPIIFSWIVGAVFAGGLAFIIGKVALGLRADYLAIATLLISEIVIAIIKHEDWLTRGVKNVIGLYGSNGLCIYEFIIISFFYNFPNNIRITISNSIWNNCKCFYT